MSKYKSLIFLSLLVFLFLLLGYIFLKPKEKQVQILEINFVSNHAIASTSGEALIKDILTFSDCFEKNDSIDYIARLSFKRTDIGNSNADSINGFKYRIDKNLTVSSANEMFDAENGSLKVTEKMFLESTGTEDDYSNDTTNVRFFYLVPPQDPRTNGSIYFDQAQKLKDYISEKLKDGTLFSDGKQKNKISVILLEGQNNNSTQSVSEVPKSAEPDVLTSVKGPVITQPVGDRDSDGVPDNKDNCPDEPGSPLNKGCILYIASNLKKPDKAGNLVKWNPELSNKSLFKLKLILIKESDNDIYFEENVSGLDKLDIPGENVTGYNGYKTTVKLEITELDNFVKVSENLKLTGCQFFCKLKEK